MARLIGPSQPPFPDTLPARTLPSPEHLLYIWEYTKWKNEHTPSIEECCRIYGMVDIMTDRVPGRRNKKRDATPIADAMKTLQKAIVKATAYWETTATEHPAMTKPSLALDGLRTLSNTLDRFPPDWLLEYQVRTVRTTWQSCAYFLYPSALGAWIRAGNPLPKPYVDDRVCLFMFHLFATINLGPEHKDNGGCVSSGALSEFLRKSFKDRPFETIVEGIRANDANRHRLENAWRAEG